MVQQNATPQTRTAAYLRPPWPAAAAALLAFAALALSSGTSLPLLILGVSLAASYAFAARFENETLTKWTLRIVVIGAPVFMYWVTATKNDNDFFDVRYLYSFALAAAAETVLQFWRREPTGGARAPFTVLLSTMVFLVGCSTLDETTHYLTFLAPAFFLFFALSLPGFRQSAGVPMPLRSALPAVLAALLLGGLAHAGLARYRNALNLLGTQSLAGRQVSPSMGMSGQPILGSSFTLRDSLTRVLRVDNPGPDLYLRGMTFDTYTGHSWGPSLDQRVWLLLPHPPNAVTGRPAHFVRLDDSLGLLFTPLHAAKIVPEAGQTIEWAARTQGPLRTPPADTDPLAYDITEGAGGALDLPPTTMEAARDLAVPPAVDRRVLALARKVGGDPPTPQAKIAAIVRFLHANNQYSLTVDPGAGEPISNFILERKAAHCEYFASAAVLLLRADGIPTRYVSGYYAHEFDGRNSLLVRQRDAHAWAESWIAGTGWVTVDATPGAGRPDALAGPIPAYWRVWEAVQDFLGAIRTWFVTSSVAAKAAVFLLLALGLAVPQVYRYLQRRRLIAPGFLYSGSDAALAEMSARFEALLDQSGVPCPEGRTWPEHLETTRLRDSGAAQRFVRAYERARFGPTPTPEEIAWIEAALKRIEIPQLETKA